MNKRKKDLSKLFFVIGIVKEINAENFSLDRHGHFVRFRIQRTKLSATDIVNYISSSSFLVQLLAHNSSVRYAHFQQYDRQHHYDLALQIKRGGRRATLDASK